MSSELTQRIIQVIASSKRIPAEKISIDSSFEELGIDSLDGIELLFALESEFDINIPDEEARRIRDVRQMVEGVARLLAQRGDASAAAGS